MNFEKNEIINAIIKKSHNRFDFCSNLINKFNLYSVAEIGVYKGDFAKSILENNTSIISYTMIDPWRNLSDWNKPANKDDNTFNTYYEHSMKKTEFAKDKRKVLRGKTTEVINEIDNDSFDFVYIDGDHTLKGITIDLISLWPKVKNGGFIVGDDFCPTIWQHEQTFEPTMVFPFAVYFAEAVNAKIYGLPNEQFMITKEEQSDFEFIDLTKGKYSDLDLRSQFLNKSAFNIKKIIKKYVPFVSKIKSISKS